MIFRKVIRQVIKQRIREFAANTYNNIGSLLSSGIEQISNLSKVCRPLSTYIRYLRMSNDCCSVIVIVEEPPLNSRPRGDRGRRITLYVRAVMGEGRKRCWACNYGGGGGCRRGTRTPCRREVIRSKLGTPSARQSAACAPLSVAPGRPLARGVPRPIDFRSRAGAGRCSRRDRQRWQRRACTAAAAAVTSTGTAAAAATVTELSQSHRRSRAHARTRRYTAATVADPSAARTRLHRVVFFFFFFVRPCA